MVRIDFVANKLFHIVSDAIHKEDYMPLLMCPNCQEGMREVDRNGVRIDICPQCRGVWLDRGELEQLLRMDNEGAFQTPPPAPAYPPVPPVQPAPAASHQRQYGHGQFEGHHGHGGHNKHHGQEHGQYPHKKRSLKDMFDIFD